MILEFKTDLGSSFQLDKDTMQWRRTAESGRITHGKLYCWPQTIEIGKRVWIFGIDPIAKIGKVFTTGVVTSINSVERVEPDVFNIN